MKLRLSTANWMQNRSNELMVRASRSHREPVQVSPRIEYDVLHQACCTAIPHCTEISAQQEQCHATSHRTEEEPDQNEGDEHLKSTEKIKIGAASPVFHVLHTVYNRVRETRLIMPR
jgi:hypothetical protein